MKTLHRYKSGEVILRENEAGDTAYIIEQGRVEIIKELDDRYVHLAYLGVGQTFGEMSMIDDKPRSATVKAVEDTLVREIHRDNFFDTLHKEPTALLDLLKVLFERLRETQNLILQLQKANPQSVLVPMSEPATVPAQPHTAVWLEGLTQHAAQSLPTNPFQITIFPFRLGRRSHDPLVHNDLMLADSAPWQISRHHLTLVKHEDRIGAVDRGSRLGAFVDGKQLGGPGGDPGPLFFSSPEGSLVLGNKRSPFRYKVVIGAAADMPRLN